MLDIASNLSNQIVNQDMNQTAYNPVVQLMVISMS